MNNAEKLEQILRETVPAFAGQKLNCAEAVLLTLARYYGWKQDYIPRIATPFGGGLGGTQRTCGALSGALMALGILYGREEGGDKTPSYEKAKALIADFSARFGEPECRTLTGIDFAGEGQMDVFRAPGGMHQTLCEGKLVPWCCQWVVDHAE